MSGWNQAPLPRDQILLFRETLGDRIPENHSVRLFAEILDGLDWSSGEQHYVLVAGQPPIHPKIMAGAILYGLTYGLRSSRRLEWACANPADRADPTRAVAREDWPKLPRRAQTGKLDRAAFVYDEQKDCYYCPMGRTLVFVQIKMKGRDTCGDSEYRVYRCRSCEGCGLATDCLVGKSKVRTVSHDQHETARQKVAARMKTERGKKAYAKRAHLAETPNGFIKQVIGLRQFLLRGLDKVRTEWLWACTAFNTRKLILAMRMLRAEGTVTLV